MSAELTDDQRAMLEEIVACGGIEVPRGWWPIARALERRGLVDLGPARGPVGCWRRAVPAGEEMT